MMPYWYYSGRTTTPIEIPGKGPIVLKPRSKFHAPQSSVAHLLRIKLVKRLPDPPQPPAEAKDAPAPAPKQEVPQPAAVEKSGSSATSAPPDRDDHASRDGVAEAKSDAPVVESAAGAAAGEAGEGEGTSSAVSEESESRRPRRSGRSRE
jgi:hypothetical protein